MVATRHFGFVGTFWDDPQREYDGLYHCVKFGCNRVWPDNAYVCPFFGCCWGKIGKNRKFLNCYPSRNAITWN